MDEQNINTTQTKTPRYTAGVGGLFDLTGKVALVTGASSGMGKAIAKAMGLHGAKVVVSSNDPVGVLETIEELQGIGNEAIGVSCDS